LGGPEWGYRFLTAGRHILDANLDQPVPCMDDWMVVSLLVPYTNCTNNLNRNWAGWVIPAHHTGITSSIQAGLRRTRGTARFHQLSHLSPRNPISCRRSPHERLVCLAPHLYRDVLRHVPQHHQPKSPKLVLPLRRHHLPRPSHHVLDLVPHQRCSWLWLPIWFRSLQALLQRNQRRHKKLAKSSQKGCGCLPSQHGSCPCPHSS